MTDNSQQHQAELHKKLWDMANSLRGQMEASEFKNYILGIIFYRFLSEKVEDEAKLFLGNNPGLTYEKVWDEQSEHREQLVDSFVDSLGYAIKPEHLYSRFMEDIKTNDFSIVTLQEAINALNSSTVGSDTQNSFDHLFDDLDLNSSKLGKTVSDRTTLIARIIEHVNSIPFNHGDVEIDILGDAYEYLISKFASTAGKSAGEFYTPQQVSKILAKLVAGEKKQLTSVYDPTCGSGSLLLRVARETKVLNYYGQELTSATYNLARMNMMLHGVSHEDFDIKNDNTLTNPQHLDQKFEAIVANPPYSAHWTPTGAPENDPRFSDYGKMAPKTKADYAFVQHMIHHLDDNGTMAVVLPHGVLFRGAAEGVIRKHLIEKNYLDAVIGLPANIFYGTSIPTSIMVFKKCREIDDKVLFIDASKEFEKGKNSNSLRDSDVKKIVSAYRSREEEGKYSRSVSVKEIKENDYNLNIPRYVDSSVVEDAVDLDMISNSIEDIESRLLVIDESIQAQKKNLRYITPLFHFVRESHNAILDSSPTLESLVYACSSRGGMPAWLIMTHDGKHVESEINADYPTTSQELNAIASKVNKYMGEVSFAVKVKRDGSAIVYYDAAVDSVIWDSFYKEKTLDERWGLFESIASNTLQSQELNL